MEKPTTLDDEVHDAGVTERAYGGQTNLIAAPSQSIKDADFETLVQDLGNVSLRGSATQLDRAAALKGLVTAGSSDDGNSLRGAELQSWRQMALDLSRETPDNLSDQLDLTRTLAEATFTLWERTNDIGDLHTHLELLQGTLSKAQLDSERSYWLDCLAKAQKCEHSVTGDLSTLRKAIGNSQASLVLTPSDDPSRMDRLITLLRIQFKEMEVMDNNQEEASEDTLKAFVGNCQLALSIVPEDHAFREVLKRMLGQGYSFLAFETRDLAMLNESLKILEDILANLTEDDPFRLQALYRLGLGYAMKAEWTGEDAHMEVGAERIEAAAELVPEGDQDRAGLFRAAASMQHDIFSRSRNLKNLEGSILLHRRAIQALPDGDSFDRAEIQHILTRLSTVLSLQKEARLQDSVHDDRGLLGSQLQPHPTILEMSESQSLTSHISGMPRSSTPLQDSDPEFLSSVEKFIFQEIKSPPYQVKTQAERTIEEGEQLLSHVPKTGYQRQLLLLVVGDAYLFLHGKDAQVRYLDQATHYFREVLETDQGQRELTNLGSDYLRHAIWMKADATQDDGDLDMAIGESETTLGLPLYDGKHRVFSLFFIGYSFRERYKRTNSEADLDQWLLIYQRALVASPVGDRFRPLALLRTGEALCQRYARRGALQDLETGIQYFCEAIELPEERESERAEILCMLGVSYVERYIRTRAQTNTTLGPGSGQDLTLAVNAAETAIKEPMINLNQTLIARSILTQVHLLKFRYCTGAQTDFHLAQDHMSLASQAILRDPDSRDHVLASLGEDWGGMFSNAQSRNWNLETKLRQLMLNGVDRNEDGRLASLLHGSGVHFYNRFQATGDMEFFQSAVKHLGQALSHEHSPPSHRIPPGLKLLKLHARRGEWDLARATASTLISLVPSTISYSLENSDKQSLVAELAGLGPDAVAVALRAGESPESALKMLESSRGVLLSSLTSIRSDVTDLQANHPEIAQRYIEVRSQVDTAPPASTSHPSYEQFSMLPEQQPGHRYSAARKLEQILATIRQLPGYESFLQAPSIEDMKAAATDGPIAILNASRYGCDALLVERTSIQSLPLPNTSYKDIVARQRDLVDARSMTTEVLEWMWDTLIEPVLQCLGITKSLQCDWPRIWWIPTGPLAKLPLHAAGYHFSDDRTVLGRAISSYSPSLTALVQSRKEDARASTPARKPDQAVMIGMKTLPYAQMEIKKVADICTTIHVTIPPPRTKDVLGSLRGCDIFHFAGHGSSNPLSPFQSSLILSDGDRLTVADLLDVKLQRQRARPFLAFLSACGTGQVKNEKLLDEGLHLTAACQVAGFRHVIGTLWAVSDTVCVKAAEIVYEWIQSHGMDDRSVSEGLHRASRALRDSWVKDGQEMRSEAAGNGGEMHRSVRLAEDYPPLLWVPYVHYGI